MAEIGNEKNRNKTYFTMHANLPYILSALGRQLL